MDEKEAVEKMRGLRKSLETTLRYEKSGFACCKSLQPENIESLNGISPNRIK